ncbi:MAG: fimbria/pilus periplasmic chaperone [Terracidiphilus sp.]|jgi:fimbrial chaperone protein
MIAYKPIRLAAVFTTAAILAILWTSLTAGAQALSVLPVNIFLPPGQMATSLTVTNAGKSETAIQIRVFAWNQKGDDDPLTATENVLLSPPIATIAPGSSQVIRIILRMPAEYREATYRILVDQIPPPAEPGVVHMVLRLSIPIFVQPSTRSFPDVQFHVERNAGQIDLVAINTGNLHEAIRDIVLTTSDGRKLKADTRTSPYILAGATRRWHMDVQDSLPPPNESLRLTAHSNAGAIDQQVRVVAAQ